ncbi:hypothetical protein N781_08965 [Pontibacillus halophilus JSM 076056 = DSM 19796]|uniref:HTH arsR-type domain-containing protein n=1 Tax=Pontibacillus halophilus JSM 076056 = DSM 19796 TaxID=1385510 RepID=A0A0A5GF46_9BACI|nr:helix-turn-helix domain-containing protein [Pontibacillus halophilus]KGX89838.1 hypothetical protein N781_08965 [Pontibacillus halophilus JSM 076056 = DSM 19796]
MNNEQLTAVFKALSHPIRVTMLDLLKEGPKRTSDLDEAFPDVSRYAVMKHLNILEEANLLLIRREGRTRLNYINIIPLQQVYGRWVSKYQSNDAHALTQIKELAERRQETMKHDTFQIEQEILIEANKENVYKALTENIGQWWAYRLCGEGSTMTLSAKAGGQFIEHGANGADALWGTVTFASENNEIRLNGLLGMQGAVNSAYSYKLEANGNHTLLKLSHHAVGLLDPEWEEQHAAGWKELLGDFLKNYVETGKTPEIK